jgi:hypothetical protein
MALIQTGSTVKAQGHEVGRAVRDAVPCDGSVHRYLSMTTYNGFPVSGELTVVADTNGRSAPAELVEAAKRHLSIFLRADRLARTAVALIRFRGSYLGAYPACSMWPSSRDRPSTRRREIRPIDPLDANEAMAIGRCGSA